MQASLSLTALFFQSSMLTLTLSLFLVLKNGDCLNNGVARTPPMGWSTWNLYHRDFTEQVFYDAADIISSTEIMLLL